MKSKLYNVIFPVWLLILFPICWLFVLPANFLLDTVILLICLILLKVSNIKEVYKKTIFKVWIVGFIADIIGAVILLVSQLFPSVSFMKDVISALAYNPFTNIWAVIYVIVAIIISAVLIYILNLKFSLKKTDLELKKKKRIALVLAIFTAPYLFFYPTEWVKVNEENNIPQSGKSIESEFSGDTITTRIFAESENYTNTKFLYIDKIAKVDSDIVESTKGSIVNMKISAQFDKGTDMTEYKKWAKQCSVIVFIKQPGIDEVVVNLNNDNKEEICKLQYTKDELEKEYLVELTSLEDNATKLQEILDSIK